MDVGLYEEVRFYYLYTIEHMNPSVDRTVTGPERSQGRLLPQQEKSVKDETISKPIFIILM